jgi:hypothetical protein
VTILSWSIIPTDVFSVAGALRYVRRLRVLVQLIIKTEDSRQLSVPLLINPWIVVFAVVVYRYARQVLGRIELSNLKPDRGN